MELVIRDNICIESKCKVLSDLKSVISMATVQQRGMQHKNKSRHYLINFR